ncbi:MAG: isoleucine--tRNA ligase [Candidatus Hecatellales archaeon]|nr:MAG: isoleucine--tRNA ligase [Candidatus Hecatellales archaeon]
MKEIKEPYDPIRLEEEIQEWWRKNGIQEKVFRLHQKGETFSFLEGPPTANGFMHIGHARGRTMKDIILRFKTMTGKNVWRMAGWDCQGLPVEIEVEKRLKIKSKRDIEKIGLDVFVEECNRLVDFYIQHWRKNSERLAVWLDYDNAYETRKDDYIEFVWWFVKKAYEKGLLKEDLKVVPTCPRCETPLSDHEVSLGYTRVKDPSIYVKFRLKDKPEEYVLIWTTTPWTLPGNEAVAVHPEADYVKVEVNGEKWIIGEKLVERVMGELGIKNYRVIETFKGKSLEGIKYVHPLIEETPTHKNHKNRFDHAIICGEHVTLEEGTGCVHTAPAHGPEDFEIGVKYGIQIFCPIDQTGHFTGDGGKYCGLYFRDANPIILEDLKKKGLLVYGGEIEHEYPLCWRCETPLIYRVDKQWFLKVSSLREKLVEKNRGVNWTPRWAGENRFGEWLANAEDWCISRARVWGSPLNIWKCRSCGNVRVVGTREELKKAAKKIPERFELHRPWIDQVILQCEKCGDEMVRVPFVVDCWLDSGVAHAASLNYLKSRELFDRLYPYQFITEAVDQTRGWFYSLLVTATILFDSSPYRRVLCQGHVLDKLGQKMSKSRGNVVWVEDVLRDYGADVLRAYLIWKAAPEDTLHFDLDELKQIKRILSIIWNVYTFATTYMVLDEFNPKEWSLKDVWENLQPEDRWILSRCQNMIANVTENLEKLQLHKALREIFDFMVEDVSRLYIRLIRRRTWVETKEIGKFAAYVTLYKIMTETLKLMSPFTPHFTEALHKFISTEEIESIHMAEWPKADQNLIDKRLEEDFRVCREAVKAALTARQRKRFKLRWPVKTVYILPANVEVRDSLLRLENVLRSQVNAKEVKVLEVGEKPPFISVSVKPFPSIGVKFKSLTPKVLEEIGRLEADVLVREILEKGEVVVRVDGEKFTLKKEDFRIIEEMPNTISREDFAYGTVFVDTEKTPEIAAEALAKEVVRRAQLMRKEMSLRIDEYVDAFVGCEDSESLRLLKTMEDYLKTEVRIRRLSLVGLDEVKPRENSYLREWLIEDEKIKIMLEKIFV